MSKKNGSARSERTDPTPRWMVYIVECSDGTFYTGITNNLARRLDQHNLGLASRYTRSRRPVTLVYREACADRSEASSREHAVKSLPRGEKARLFEKGGTG